MFMIKLLVKIIVFPVFLMVCFIRTWVGVLSKVGCVMIALGMSFGAFLMSFAAAAVGMALEGIGDKMGEFLES